MRQFREQTLAQARAALYHCPVFASLKARATRGVVAALLGAAAACADQPFGPLKNFQDITVGDTVTGNLKSGEPQLFKFPTYSESSYAVFLQSLSGNKTVVVSDTSEAWVLASGVAAPGMTLLQRGVGPFFFGEAPVEVKISGDAGGFRLLVYSVRRGPEGRAAGFAIGDTVAETLGTLADIDTFSFAGQAGQEVIAYLQALNDSPVGVLNLSLSGLRGTWSAAGDSDLEQNPTGRFLLPNTAHYTVTVQAATDGYGYRTYRGPYRFQVRAINQNPERVPGTIAPGDSVTAEGIDYIGDVDQYILNGAAGEVVNVFLQNRSGAPTSAFYLRGTVGDSAVAATSLGTDTSLYSRFSGRMKLKGGGQDTLRVEGVLDDTLRDRGKYALFVYPVNPAPESAPAAIVAGDSIENEAIDLPGDLDTFQVTVAETTLANLVLGLGGDATGGALTLTLRNGSGTLVAILSSAAPGTTVPSGTFPLVPGVYRLRANPDDFSGFRGHYSVRLYAGFTTRPETVGDTISIGDTVSAEAISPPGDIDEFIGTATPGSTLIPAYRLRAGPVPFGGSITLEVVDPVTGAVLIGAGASLDSASSQFLSPGSFVVPASGTYVVRVHSYNNDTAAPYEFFVRQGP